MVNLLEQTAQAFSIAGLVFGVFIVFRHWRRTVPPGADSDAEFANHSHFTPAPVTLTHPLLPQQLNGLPYLVVRPSRRREEDFVVGVH